MNETAVRKNRRGRLAEPPKISKTELNRMADVVNEKGVQIETVIDGRTYRVMPREATGRSDGVVVPVGGILL